MISIENDAATHQLIEKNYYCNKENLLQLLFLSLFCYYLTTKKWIPPPHQTSSSELFLDIIEPEIHYHWPIIFSEPTAQQE